VTVVRDRKIRTTLRTNQIAEFVTVTAWKKIIESTQVEHALKLIVLQYILTSVARPSSFAGPASPRHIAQTIEDLPVPGNTIYSKYSITGLS